MAFTEKEKNIDAPKRLRLVSNDPGLLPYESAIQGRFDYAARREQELTNGETLVDWANGYHYFGIHSNTKLWYIREWAPNATAVYLVGDMNGWRKSED